MGNVAQMFFSFVLQTRLLSLIFIIFASCFQDLLVASLRGIYYLKQGTEKFDWVVGLGNDAVFSENDDENLAIITM